MKHFVEAITLKRAILIVTGIGWLALTASDYGLLTGRRSTHYAAKFTQNNEAFETAECLYWIGLGRRVVFKSGPPNSVSCDWTLRMENKWESKKVVSGSQPAIIVSDR